MELRTKPEKKAVPMIRMSEIQQTEVEWLWYPYIPFGKLTIIQGNPGEGKTFLLCSLQWRVPTESICRKWNRFSRLM